MRIIGIIFLGVIIFATFGSLMDDDSGGSSGKSSEPSIDVDTSPAMQERRRKLIEELKREGVIYKVNDAGMYVDSRWDSIKYDQKRAFASMVFAYRYTQNKNNDYLVIYSGRTGNDIGGYGRHGLSLDD